MFRLFTARKILPLILILLFVFSLPAAAKTTEWKNPAYNFGQVKTIWIKNPVFSYNYHERDTSNNKNYFEKYPRSADIIRVILAKQTEKLPKYNFIYEPAENTHAAQAQTAPPSQTTLPPAAETLPANNPEPAGDLVLSLKIVDFGWYYEHYEGYWATESVPKEEIIYERDSSGRMSEARRKTTTIIIPVYHPPGYYVKEFAAAEFTFSDAKTGEEVWRYTDYRDRASSTFSGGRNGPESMMNRVFSSAFDKMPLIKK